MLANLPLKVTFRLALFEQGTGGERQVRDVKEEELYFGELPLMTETGTFIINGTERVIVSQLHRSPGVFFTLEGPNHYLAKVVPYRGSWIEFEYDNKQVLWVRIDRKRKFYGTVFLRALGLKSDAEILKAFYKVSDITIRDKKLYWKVSDAMVGFKLSYAITKGKETVVPQGRKITQGVYKEILKAKMRDVAGTKAKIIATANTGCMMQLEAGLRRFGPRDAQVAHVVELLDEAYRALDAPTATT